MRHTLYLLPYCLFTLLFACNSPQDTPEPTEPGRTELLVAKQWKITGLNVNPARARVLGGPLVEDWYEDEGPCRQDDTKLYHPDGTVTYDEGGSRCSPNDAQTLPGTWLFNTDETIITEIKRTFFIQIRSYDILELSATRLVLQREEILFDSLYTFTETYEALSTP